LPKVGKSPFFLGGFAQNATERPFCAVEHSHILRNWLSINNSARMQIDPYGVADLELPFWLLLWHGAIVRQDREDPR
jgi:hypothetical protein